MTPPESLSSHFLLLSLLCDFGPCRGTPVSQPCLCVIECMYSREWSETFSSDCKVSVRMDKTSLLFKNKISAQRVSFWDGYPADIRGSFARISRPKTSVRALKILENKHLGADIHDPKARTSTTLRDFQKLRSEKLWAEFLFPILRQKITL